LSEERHVSTSGRFLTHHIPDDGTRYVPGETVRVDHSSGRIQLVKDLNGEYEVMSCRPATEYGSNPPLLRVDLRKRVATPPAENTDPWAPRSPYDR
jgi:hypothetical protein